MLTLNLKRIDDNQEITISIIYASNDRNTRVHYGMLCMTSTQKHTPWLVGGDFNVITDETEKFDGLSVSSGETEDFLHCLNVCLLSDMGFTGSMFTWWNERFDEACIFKRLDRCLGNQVLMNIFPNLQVEHLIKQGSDHAPLLIDYKMDSRIIKKSFRFLNFWIEQESFLEVVRQNWSGNFGTDPFFIFHNKLKKVSKALSKWSKDMEIYLERLQH